MKFDLLTLSDHQYEGLDACIEGFQVFDRLQVHMACGTGKTRLGQAVCHELGSHTTLLLFPSLPLTSQTLTSWIAEGSINHSDILCVCSDPSVVEQDEDDHIISAPIQISTDPSQIKNFFIGRDPSRPTYIFCTYHSLPALAKGLPESTVIDLCVFDEAHRVVGDAEKNFAYGLHNHSDLTIDKRLFMTATPRLLMAEEGSSDLVYSMSNEQVFGPVVYTLSLHEAIERGIICDYQIIVSLQEDDEAHSSLYDEPSQGHHDLVFKSAALLQTMENVGAHKAFTFHQRISLSRQFNETLTQVAAHRQSRLNAWHVDGGMSEGERHAILRQFATVPTGVVSCSRCLSEGTNVPVTDLVAFMDPRSSETDIVQTLGRALRRAPGKKLGYVLIPLKLEHGVSVEEMLSKSSMRHVWRVLASVAEMDESYVRELRQIRRDIPSSQWSSTSIGLLDRIHVQASKDITEQAYRSLKFQIVDRLTSRWDTSFGEFMRFVREQGHARVPRRFVSESGLRLGMWCTTQRMLGRTQMLDAQRKRELEEAGFDFEPHQTSWDEAFFALKSYAVVNGNHHVPQAHMTEQGLSLGDWCADQRKLFKSGRLSPEREQQLRDEGFSFTPTDDAWMSNYQALKAFWSAHGHTNLAKDREDEASRSLNTWLQNQRQRKPSSDRRELLEALGVTFTSQLDQAWNEGFDRLESYLLASDGNLPVAGYATEDGFSLGNWISNQRQAHSSGKLSPERAQKLESIGFVFNAEDAAFETGLNELQTYKDKHGHANVPIAYVSESGYKLGTWCGNVRTRMKKNPDAERLAKLAELGFALDANAQSWQSHFELCVLELKKRGFVNTNAEASTGERIGAWLYRQVAKGKAGTLKPDQKAKLAQAGFIKVVHSPSDLEM